MMQSSPVRTGKGVSSTPYSAARSWMTWAPGARASSRRSVMRRELRTRSVSVLTSSPSATG